MPCRMVEPTDFYPRPPRGGRRTDDFNREVFVDISIHALREEGDRHRPSAPDGDQDFYPRPPRGGRLCVLGPRLHAAHISIHALREEGDQLTGFFYDSHHKFLSTPSARRATLPFSAGPAIFSHFYPRPPRGGRHVQAINDHQYIRISIHALREEGDGSSRAK